MSDVRPTPLFIVGVGRSGTSLLQSMLAAHTEIVSLPETGFLRREVFSGTGEAKTWSQWTADDARLSRVTSAAQDLVRGFSSDTGRDSIAAETLYEAVRAAYVDTYAGDAPCYLLDKDPRLIEFLPAVFARYPDAQIVHIVRDPRDVVLSKEKAAWSARRPWWFNLLIGVVQLQEMYRMLAPPCVWRVISVRYEDLLSDTSATLRRITDELDLHFDYGMLAYGDTANELRADDEASWKDNVSGPLLTGNSGKWRTAMSPLRQAICDRLAGRELRRGGYDRSDVPSSPHRLIAGVFAILLLPVRAGLRLVVRHPARRVTA